MLGAGDKDAAAALSEAEGVRLVEAARPRQLERAIRKHVDPRLLDGHRLAVVRRAWSGAEDVCDPTVNTLVVGDGDGAGFGEGRPP